LLQATSHPRGAPSAACSSGCCLWSAHELSLSGIQVFFPSGRVCTRARPHGALPIELFRAGPCIHPAADTLSTIPPTFLSFPHFHTSAACSHLDQQAGRAGVGVASCAHNVGIPVRAHMDQGVEG